MTDSPAAGASPVVDMRGITVEFAGIKALAGVDFRLFPGEVHALMGENGAGKSTLIKALTGVYRPTAGTIRLKDEPVEFTTPGQAQDAGISTVYQEVNLCPNLSVAENILLGHEPRRLGAIDGRAMRARAAELLARIGLTIDPASVLSSHSIAVQQLVAIARALVVDARVLVLDEPTSSLDSDEVEELFRIVRVLRDEGVAILFVSHFLDQVYELSDRMTVLRNGTLVGEYLPRDLDRMGLVSAMLGRELGVLSEVERRSEERAPGSAPVLVARGLGRAARSSRSTWRSTRARSWASPACWAPAGPNSPGCCAAPTAPTRARSPSTGRRSGPGVRARSSPRASPSAPRTARPRASSPT